MILLTTTDHIPDKKYEIIGIVSENRSFSIFAKTEISKVVVKLQDEAEKMGADAVVGIKVFTTSRNGTSLMGTAVKFI